MVASINMLDIPLDTGCGRSNLVHPPPLTSTRSELRRSSIPILCLVIAGACTIEQTPQQYIDRQDSLADQIAISEEELAGRLRSLPRELRAPGDSAAFARLRPDSQIIVLSSADGDTAIGVGALRAAFRATAGPGPYFVEHASTRVGPNNDVGWFTAIYRPAESAAPLRVSGVFSRRSGEWMLIQSHISAESASASSAVPLESPDSVRGGG